MVEVRTLLVVLSVITYSIQNSMGNLGVSIEPPPSRATCAGLSVPIPRGEKGSLGTSGVPGSNGTDGEKGDKGEGGAKGDLGTRGYKGDPGLLGTKGDQGTAGPVGIKGEKGVEGACAGQCGGDSQLNETVQALLANYTAEIRYLMNKVAYLERNILYPLGSEDNPAVSCKEIYKRYQSTQNGLYYIQTSDVPGGKVKIFCQMIQYDDSCPKGLTQVMKIDGSKSTFKYSSSLWTNKESHKPENGQTGSDYLETKLPTYWSTPFTKICIRMRRQGSWMIYYASLDIQANSMYDLIADNQYRATSLGVSAWKSLIPYSTLQSQCSKEGFNVQGSSSSYARVRIGVVGDDSSTCSTPNSFIGFGTSASTCGTDSSTSCGNEAGCNGAHGNMHEKTHGYIYVY